MYVVIDVREAIGEEEKKIPYERTELALMEFQSLSRETGVERNQFLKALENTGRFSSEEAGKMVQMLLYSGQIYESSPGRFRKI